MREDIRKYLWIGGVVLAVQGILGLKGITGPTVASDNPVQYFHIGTIVLGNILFFVALIGKKQISTSEE